ncbi:unnamed protein product [Didymodactylos carnosus]|uniref:DED domain-containing protein n=1 Tax=Didymodactylos carnosus TaxID=1234261 RepID=A0A8S2EBM7_9BILA|nr:unnamed protein product [Didymodactylos carnosus]CAF3993342.1 unnamed protein product [Didymodactylos carnosus]
MGDGKDFRGLLLHIHFALSDEDAKNLKFMVGNDIPRRLENKDLIEVFSELIQRNKISPDNFDYLIKQLETIERPDLAEHLKEYKRVVVTAEMQSSCTREIPKNDILSLLMQDQEKEQPEPIQKGSLDNEFLSDSHGGRAKRHIATQKNQYWQLLQQAYNERNTIIVLERQRESGLVAYYLTEYTYFKEPSSSFLSYYLLTTNSSMHGRSIMFDGSPHLTLIDGESPTSYSTEQKDGKRGITVTLNNAKRLLNNFKMNETLSMQISLIIFNVCASRNVSKKNRDEDEIESYIEFMTYLNNLKLSMARKPKLIIIRLKEDAQTAVWDKLMHEYNEPSE